MVRRLLVGAGLALLLGAAAACGGGGQAPQVATAQSGAQAASPTPSLSDAQRALNYVHCMRAHGIQMRDPVDGVKGLDPVGGPAKGSPGEEAYVKKLEAAQAACAPLAPPGSVDGAPLTQEQQDQQRQFAQCMRGKGIKMRDPVGNQLAQPEDPEVLRQPAFLNAMKACRSQLHGSPGTSTRDVP